MASWCEEALAFLAQARREEGAWGYAPGGDPWSEPTACAGLARLAHDQEPGGADAWLAGQQLPDGAVAPSPGLTGPGWVTSYAMLLWAEVGQAQALERGAGYLLGLEGLSLPRTPTLGHDTTIVGWPWVERTHSWVEPTAMAMLALRRAGRGDHPRLEQGEALLLDRIVKGGGWNYGNTRQFQTDLQAFPAPTGVALLALRARWPEPRLEPCVAFLAERAPGLRSPISLAWAVLGLAATRGAPLEADGWLERSWRLLVQLGPRVVEASLLLLAARPQRALAAFAPPTPARQEVPR